MALPEHASGAEIFVIEGSIEGSCETLDRHSWLRIPAGESHKLTTREGCVLYIKNGALGALRSVSS